MTFKKLFFPLLSLAALLAVQSPVELTAQPKVLTPGRIKVVEGEPKEDPFMLPPLEENQGLLRFTLDPSLEKYYKPEEVATFFRESRIIVDGVQYDKNVSARPDGSISIRFTFSFISGQDEISRRIQIKDLSLFARYFQSHKIYRQRISNYTLSVADEPVLEKEAKGTVVVDAGTVTDLEIEAIGNDGVTLKFFENTFELKTGSYMISVSKTGYENFRQRITVKNDGRETIKVNLKQTAGGAAVAQAITSGKYREAVLNRLKASRTLTARRPVSGGIFSPDGSQLVTWHTDNLIYLWNDLIKGQYTVLPGHTTEVKGASFYAEENLLFSYSETQIILYDLKTGKAQTTIQTRDIAKSGITAAAYLPDTRTVVVSSKDNKHRSFNIGTKALTPEVDEDVQINAMTILPGKKSFAAMTADGRVKIRTGVNTAGRQLRAGGNLKSGFVSRNSKYFVTSSEDQVFTDNTVSVFDVKNLGENPLASIKASVGLAVFENMTLVAVENAARTLSLFDLLSGKMIYTARNIVIGEKFGVLSPDGSLLATNGAGNEIQLYDLTMLTEWQLAMKFAREFETVTNQEAGLATVRPRLLKPANLFWNAAAKRKYEVLLDDALKVITAEKDKPVRAIRDAQRQFYTLMSEMESELLPQQTVETRAEFEKRAENAVQKLEKAQEVYLLAVQKELVGLQQALLKGVVFEQTNQSMTFPTTFEAYDKTRGVLPVKINAIETFLSVSEAEAPKWQEAIRTKGWNIERSDVTVEPVTYRLYAQLDSGKVYPGGNDLYFSLAVKDIYTDLFTIDLQASGFVTFALSDKKSAIQATAIRDGNSFSVIQDGKGSATEFRPGLYDVLITSKNNKPISWRVQVDPGMRETISFDQIGSKKQSATLSLRGSEVPYKVTIQKPDKKVVSYNVWSQNARLELPKGAYTFQYFKEGYVIKAKNAAMLVNGAEEEIILQFSKKSADGSLQEIPALAAATPKTPAPTHTHTPPATPQPAVTKKKGGSMKWLLLLAAAGGGGYYVLSSGGSGGASALPAPPGRPN